MATVFHNAHHQQYMEIKNSMRTKNNRKKNFLEKESARLKRENFFENDNYSTIQRLKNNEVVFLFGPIEILTGNKWLVDEIMLISEARCGTYNRTNKSFQPEIRQDYLERSIESSSYVGLCVIQNSDGTSAVASFVLLKNFDEPPTDADIYNPEIPELQVGIDNSEIYLDVLCGTGYKDAGRILVHMMQVFLYTGNETSSIRLFALDSAFSFWSKMGFVKVFGNACLQKSDDYKTQVRENINNGKSRMDQIVQYVKFGKKPKIADDDGVQMKFCLKLNRLPEVGNRIFNNDVQTYQLAIDKTFYCESPRCVRRFFKQNTVSNHTIPELLPRRFLKNMEKCYMVNDY